MALTREEEVFVLNILTPDVSVADAYARAYNQYGMGKKSATSAGCRLLNRNDIKKKLAERHRAMTEKLEITAERIEQEVAKIAFGKVTDVLTWQQGDDGLSVEVKASREIEENAISTIKSIKATKDGGAEIVFHDKQRALETLGRRFRRFNEVTEIEDLSPEEKFTKMTPEDKLSRIRELQERFNNG
jgi:phage terminase small subunit